VVEPASLLRNSLAQSIGEADSRFLAMSGEAQIKGDWKAIILPHRWSVWRGDTEGLSAVAMGR
jgi:hypothetical protein